MFRMVASVAGLHSALLAMNIISCYSFVKVSLVNYKMPSFGKRALDVFVGSRDASKRHHHHHAHGLQMNAGNEYMGSSATKDILSYRVIDALRESFTELKEQAHIDPMLIPTSKAEFGDYQCNIAMALSKALKLKPRDVAAKVVAELEKGSISDLMISKLEIAGPGFINIFLSEQYICNRLYEMSKDSNRLSIAKASSPQRIIVDFSSPSIAKEMHVGHLRSTIIGDSISRILEFLGHDVKRLNHVGDLGTQFGIHSKK